MPKFLDAICSGRRLLSRRAALAIALAVACLGSLMVAQRPLTAPLPDTIEISDLTWVEVREFVRHGYTTVIVPSGGLEQNGPNLIIGKHDRVVTYTARRIATALGRTLVTPVVSFVPEGRHWPPTGHMRFPGTIGVTEEVFAGTLDGIARSLKAAGFQTICLIADHGESLPPQKQVAERLSREWAAEGVKVMSVDGYTADPQQVAWLKRQGETDGTIGRHGGIQDTAELMAADPAGVRPLGAASRSFLTEATGADGDPARASAEQGRALLDMKVDAAVAEIRSRMAGGLALRRASDE